MTTVLTGLVKRPTFEEAIAYKNPTVKVPSRSAWHLRNSIQLSQFDGLHEDHDRAFLREIEEEQEQAFMHQAFEQRYRREGIPYAAQGPGGPPPPIPPGLGPNGRGAAQQDRASEASAMSVLDDLELQAGSMAQQQAMGQVPQRAGLSAEDLRIWTELAGDAASLGGTLIGGAGRLGWAAARRAPGAIMGLANAVGAVAEGGAAVADWLTTREPQAAHEADLQRRLRERDEAAARMRSGSGWRPVRSESSASGGRSQYGVVHMGLAPRSETVSSGRGSVTDARTVSRSTGSTRSNPVVGGRVREIEARIPGINRRR